MCLKGTQRGLQARGQAIVGPYRIMFVNGIGRVQVIGRRGLPAGIQGETQSGRRLISNVCIIGDAVKSLAQSVVGRQGRLRNRHAKLDSGPYGVFIMNSAGIEVVTVALRPEPNDEKPVRILGLGVLPNQGYRAERSSLVLDTAV